MEESRPLRSTRRLSNRAWDRPAWYSISNSVAGVPVQVTIYDEIGFFGVSAGQFMADLDGQPGDIEMHINSPGGDIYDGLTIYNRLKQRSGSIHVTVDGLAASAASFIAMAASPGQLEMAPRSEMMIHNGFTMAIGDAGDLRKTADLLDRKTADIASIYADRSGKPVDYWLDRMTAETWYSAAEAVAEGLADKIQGQDAPRDAWDLSVFAHAPGTVANAAPADGEPGKPGEPEPGAILNAASGDGDGGGGAAKDGVTDLGDGWVKDADGTVRFDPDGDGDDDSTPEGDTDHDYFDADGKPVKPIPPKPGAKDSASAGDDEDGRKKAFPGAKPPFRKADARATFPLLDADVDNSPWDASRAWSNGATSDDPAAFYKGICAGRKSGDPKTQAAWALPYKYHPGDAPNAAGVRAALGALSGARGGVQGLTNADEAKAKLQKIMKSINPDYDPEAKADSPWDAAKAWAAGAVSPDPARFYAGICAGRRAGDPATQDAWALPYRYHPDHAANPGGVEDALSWLPHTADLTNPDEAKALLRAEMKRIDPDYDPDALPDKTPLASLFDPPPPGVDDRPWYPEAAMAAAAASADPAAFYLGICAGRKPGDAATREAWDLPYRYHPDADPNADGVRSALAAFPVTRGLTNATEARALLEKAMRRLDPAEPDDHIDPALLAAVFTNGLEGAGIR